MTDQDALLYFGKNVRYLRKLHGLSKQEMAKKLMIGVDTLNKLEAGMIPPRLDARAIIMMMSHFDVSAEDLLKTEMETAQKYDYIRADDPL